jgi:Ca-activated chloride channel family protein
MSFASPWLLLTLLLVPLAIAGYVLVERRRGRQAEAWSTPALVPNMVEGRPGRRRYVPAALFLVGLVLLLVGFARPEATMDVTREGATVVIAVDISGSMDTKDVEPTRLLAARRLVTEFVEELPDKYRVGLVTFSDHTTVRVTPTYDRDHLLRAFPRKAQELGTALGDAVGTSVTVASRAVGKSTPGQPHPPAAVLLISDGTQTVGETQPATAAARARELEVPVSTVVLGTPNGVLEREVPGTDYTERLQVPVDPEALKTIADTSRGTFYEAATADQLSRVHEDLGSRLVQDRKRREVTVVVTAAALGFILVAAAFSAAWFRRLV